MSCARTHTHTDTHASSTVVVQQQNEWRHRKLSPELNLPRRKLDQSEISFHCQISAFYVQLGKRRRNLLIKNRNNYNVEIEGINKNLTLNNWYGYQLIFFLFTLLLAFRKKRRSQIGKNFIFRKVFSVKHSYEITKK
jgi:hypothetical protein